MSSLYTIDQLKWLSDRFEEDGLTSDEVNALAEAGRLRAFRGVIRGTHEIRQIEHMLDLAVPCNLPFNGAERVSPAKSGVVRYDLRDGEPFLGGEKINLFLSEKQKTGVSEGHELRKELEARGGNVSAKLLDLFVEHPELWPESWKENKEGDTIYVHFFDDIFRDPSNDDLCVRFGCCRGGEVVSDYRWLGNDWDRHYPSASLAS